MNIHYFEWLEKERYVRYLHSLDTGPLVIDQLRAAASLSGSDRYPTELFDYRAEDIARLLNRPDFDDAEKIRFTTIGIQEGRTHLFRRAPCRTAVLKALCSDTATIRGHGYTILRGFPAPGAPEDRSFYEQIADALLVQYGEINSEERPEARKNTAELIRCLLALERITDAIEVLNKETEDGLHPEPFMAALESGAVAWCRHKIDAMSQLPPEERIDAWRAFDDAMAGFMRGHHNILRTNTTRDNLAREEALRQVSERIINALLLLDRAGPFNNTFMDWLVYVEGNEKARQMIAADVDALDDENPLAMQLKACFAVAGMQQGDPEYQDDPLIPIAHYLTHPDVDDFDRIDFMAQSVTKHGGQALRLPEQRIVVDGLKENPALEKRYGIDVLTAYPMPEAGDAVIYNRVGDRILAGLDGDPTIKGTIAPAHVEMLFALDREGDALRLLNDDSLQFCRSPNAFFATLHTGQRDWCRANLESLMQWNLQLDLREIPSDSGEKELLHQLIDAVDDADLQLASRIFFAEVMQADDATWKQLAAQCTKHGFQRPEFAVQAHAILEQAGALERTLPDPAAVAWAEDGGLDRVVQQPVDLNPVERFVVERYINNMLDDGQVDKVVTFYESALGKVTGEEARWLSDIPVKVEAGLVETLRYGNRCDDPGRFRNITLAERFTLQKTLDDLSRECKGLSPNIAHMNLGICYLSGQREEFQQTKNVGCWSLERLFVGFTLLEGVQAGEVDEQKMKDCIADFGAAMKYYKREIPGGFIGRFNWYDIASSMLETYPYSLDQARWTPEVLERLPIELDPDRLEQFMARRAKERA